MSVNWVRDGHIQLRKILSTSVPFTTCGIRCMVRLRSEGILNCSDKLISNIREKSASGIGICRNIDDDVLQIFHIGVKLQTSKLTPWETWMESINPGS